MFSLAAESAVAMTPQTSWPGAAGLDEGRGLPSVTSGPLTMDGILHGTDVAGHWQSSSATQESLDPALLINITYDISPDISGNRDNGLNRTSGQDQVQDSTSSYWNQLNDVGKQNCSHWCVAGTLDDSGELLCCDREDCYELYNQDTLGNSSAFELVSRYRPSTPDARQRSNEASTTSQFQQLNIPEVDLYYRDFDMMLDQINQEEQLSSSQSSSSFPWIAISGHDSECQEEPDSSALGSKGLSNSISLFPRTQEDIQGLNHPQLLHQGSSRNSSSYLGQDFSLPANSLKDAYQRLEINWVLLPDANEIEKQALSVISGLSMDRVRAFYVQKHFGATFRGVAQSQETQSLLGIQTIDKADINFHDSTYCSYSSSGSSVVQSRHNTSELDSTTTSPDGKISKPLKGQKKAMQRQNSCDIYQIPRPFECTWRGCSERFKSKRDWKRHEESIHCQQSVWKCPVNVSRNSRNHEEFECGREFKRDDKFREHLRNTKSGHGYDDNKIGTMVEDFHQPLFPASHFRNDCGFCGRYLPSWDIRIEHIADEYTKNGKNMSMWKDPWPRESSSSSKLNSDYEDDDGENDGDDSGDNYDPRNSSSGRNASSKTEPKDRRGGDASRHSDQVIDRRGAAYHKSHKKSSADGPLLDNAACRYKVKQQTTMNSSASNDNIMSLLVEKKRSSKGMLAFLLHWNSHLVWQFVYKNFEILGVVGFNMELDEQFAVACYKRSAGIKTSIKRCRWPKYSNRFTVQRLYKCQYAPCSYESRFESNCKQHMEKCRSLTCISSKHYGLCHREVGETCPPGETLWDTGITDLFPPGNTGIGRNVDRLRPIRAKPVTQVADIGCLVSELFGLRSFGRTPGCHWGNSSEEHAVSHVQQSAEKLHNHTSEKEGTKPILLRLPYGSDYTKPRLSKQEVDILEEQFQKHHKPSSAIKRLLAEWLQVDIARINNWFQNRRAKAKHERKAEEFGARQQLLDSDDDSMLMESTARHECSAFRSSPYQFIELPSKAPTPSQTGIALNDVVDSHKRRIALILAEIDHGLSGMDLSQNPQRIIETV